MASDTGSSSRLIVRAATAALLSFALLPPAYAQFWGNSWGGRQQQPQQRYNPYAQQPYNPKDKRMRKILLTGVAALLMAISAHATENPDMCAVVLKTPDGFLALRTKPEPKSKMMSKLFPGQVWRVDIDKYRSKNWIYVEGLVENSERLDGWVYSKYIQSFVCPISGEAATGAQKSLLPSHPTRQNEAAASTSLVSFNCATPAASFLRMPPSRPRASP